MRKVLYIFGQLSDEDIEWMSRAGRRQRTLDGQVLLREGEQVSHLFIMLEGVVTVAVSGLGVVAELGSGEVIGEMSFVDSAPAAATVTAVGGGTVLALDKRDVAQRLRAEPGFAGRFYKALAIFLADRLRGTVDRLKPGDTNSLARDEIKDELDPGIVDQVSLAGVRFERMLKTLLGAPAV